MSRVQLALNVSDLDDAIAFYSKLFETEPAKVRPGYANFAIDEPPLKLVLMENPGQAGTLNHLGVEVFSVADVSQAQTRLAERGLSNTAESGTCCYAQQEKVWVDAPDRVPWEIYTVVADADPETTDDAAVADTCCGTQPAAAATAPARQSCC